MDAFEEQPDSAAAPAADPFAGGEPDAAADFLGQAHDMFSRIFWTRIYEFFLPTILEYILFILIFSNS